MPLIGDPARFAIEYELHEEYGGVWLFGTVCYHIGGERVGDVEVGESLCDFLFQIEEGRRDHGRRQSERFGSMPAREVVELLETALFGPGGEELDEIATEEQWARHKLTPALEAMGLWWIYLVETEERGRLMYGRLGEEVREVLLSPGECDQVLEQACVEIGALRGGAGEGGGEPARRGPLMSPGATLGRSSGLTARHATMLREVLEKCRTTSCSWSLMGSSSDRSMTHSARSLKSGGAGARGVAGLPAAPARGRAPAGDSGAFPVPPPRRCTGGAASLRSRPSSRKPPAR